MKAYVFQDLKDGKVYSTTDPILPHIQASYPNHIFILLDTDTENMQRDIHESGIMGSVLPQTRRSSSNERDV